jgi:hypothetical protein
MNRRGFRFIFFWQNGGSGSCSRCYFVAVGLNIYIDKYFHGRLYHTLGDGQDEI